MRFLGLLLPLFAALPLTAAQETGGQGPTAEIAVSSDWERVLSIYKLAQGGKDRFDALRTISFDYTPSIFDLQGEELRGTVQHVDVLFRPDLDEQEQRTVRIETEVATGEGDATARTISLVTGADIKVWVEGADGEFVRSEARELERNAGFHATVLLTHLDLIFWPDSQDIRCQFGGVLKRGGRDYATVEAEFSPGRAVPEPARLYFSGLTSLIERIDAFDPTLRMRIGTLHVEEYRDHGGIKFPELFRQVNRKGEAIGNWYLSEVKLNEEQPRESWLKP